MYGYVYLTTNLINGKKYIGSHKYDKLELDETYLGSGKTLTKAIKKYGKNNFRCVILEYCETRDILIERERFYIANYNAVESSDYYNIDDGRGNSHLYVTQESTKNKLSQIQKNHITINNGTEQVVINKSELDSYLKMGYKIGRLPKDYSERIKKFKDTHYSKDYEHKLNEWKQNISKSIKGRKWITNGFEDKQVSQEDADKLIKLGWKYGRIFAKGKK